MDQPKLERLLRLMMLLTANTYYTVEGLAERMETLLFVRTGSIGENSYVPH